MPAKGSQILGGLLGFAGVDGAIRMAAVPFASYTETATFNDNLGKNLVCRSNQLTCTPCLYRPCGIWLLRASPTSHFHSSMFY
jgi:hypothetical protein